MKVTQHHDVCNSLSFKHLLCILQHHFQNSWDTVLTQNFFVFFLTNMFILNLINATNINKVQTTSPDDCNKEDDWPLICRTKAGEGFANISNLHKKRY